MLEVAKMHLKGAARHWFGSHSEINNYDEFKQAFRRTFVKARKQNSNETINSYFHEKVNLCSDLKMSIDKIKEKLAIGIALQELSSIIIISKTKDSDELYHEIMNFEKITEAPRGRRKEVLESRVTNEEIK